MTAPVPGSGTPRGAYARTDALHPPHDPVPLRPVPASPVAGWPAGTFIENLAPAPGETSGWLVTIPSHNRVDHLHPNGRHEVLAELTNPAGIVSDGTSALVVTGPMGSQGWRLVRLGEPRARAGADTVCDLPDLIFGNGMTRAGDHLLIADSLHGHVLAADPASGASSVRLAHHFWTAWASASACSAASSLRSKWQTGASPHGAPVLLPGSRACQTAWACNR